MESRAETPSADELIGHAAFVRWLAFDLVGDTHEAEEVAQETMLRSLERPPAILESAKAWLAGVTRNVVRMRRRTEGRRARRERIAARPDSLPSAADSAATMEVLRRLTDAVDDIGEPYRATILLRYYEGLMPSEIARRTGVPVKTVKTRLHRALLKLRERLDERHGGRKAWTLALLPFVRRTPAGLSPIVPGAILVSLKSKISLAVAGVLVVAAAVAFSVSDPESPSLPEQRDESILAAMPDETDPPPDAKEEAEVSVAFTPPASTSEAVPGAECTVEARVIDAETGKPLAGVTVHRHGVEEEASLDPDDPDTGTMWIGHVLEDRVRTTSTFTGKDGSVRFGAKPGPHVLIVRHPRYRDFVGRRFPLRAGDEKTFEIRLEPYPEGERELEFGGVVTDGEIESPLADARVVCRYRKGPEIVTVEARTGADGRYVLVVPKNALLGITFDKEGYETRRAAVNPVHQPWYPGDAALVRVRGGPRKGFGRITGKITDAVTGEAVPGAAISLERGLDSKGGGGIGGWSGFKSGPDGRYRIDLRPVDDAEEWVLITVFRPGYAKLTTELVSFAPDRTTEHHIAMMADEGSAAFKGTTVDAETGKPVAGARVFSEDPFGELLGAAESDETGRFSVPLRGREYALRVTAEGYGPVELPAEDLPEPLRIALERADCAVTGAVRDGATGRPIPGATLTYYYRDGEGWCGPGPATVTDENGAYRMDLPSGRYVVRARAPGFGARYGQPVDLANGAKVETNIALLARDCELTGRVLDAATRSALPRAAENVFTVRLPIDEADRINCDMAPYEEMPDVATDGARFTLPLTPGRYRVLVNLNGYLPFEKEIRIQAGEKREIEVELTPSPGK